MSLFRRRSAGAADDRAAVFWAWWTAEGHTLAEASLDGSGDPQDFAEVMNARVEPLGLGWELTAGEAADHVLVLTPEGDLPRRALARRVVLAAPEADAAWSYLDARPPLPHPEGVVIGTEGSEAIDFSQVSVSARLDRGRFDVQLHHPAFADLSEEQRLQVTFLALDAALGEIDTELWLGEVTPVGFPPLDGFGLTALRSVVQDLKRQRLDRDGRPGWVMLHGETPTGPLVAMARSPLHALTAPNLDTYVAVALPYAHRTADGQPDEGSLRPLQDFEARLAGELDSSGQVVAHLSADGTRTLHVYIDSTADLLPAVKGLAKSWDQGKAGVHDMYDPGWQAVQHLSG